MYCMNQVLVFLSLSLLPHCIDGMPATEYTTLPSVRLTRGSSLPTSFDSQKDAHFMSSNTKTHILSSKLSSQLIDDDTIDVLNDNFPQKKLKNRSPRFLSSELSHFFGRTASSTDQRHSSAMCPQKIQSFSSFTTIKPYITTTMDLSTPNHQPDDHTKEHDEQNSTSELETKTRTTKTIDYPTLNETLLVEQEIEEDIVPNEFVIHSSSVDTLSMVQYARSLRVNVKEEFGVGTFHGMIVQGNLAEIQKLMMSLRQAQHMVEVSPNRKFNLDMIQWNSPWNLARVSTRDPPKRNIFCYNRTSNGKDVDVYVLDSGIIAEHPEFENRASEGPSFVKTADSRDFLGHGTHVSGLIAGKTFGVAKASNVIGLRVVYPHGKADSISVIKAMEWIWHRVRETNIPSIANLSFSGSKDGAVNAAAAALVNAGIYVITSAGNGYGKDACSRSPSSAPGVISVGATNHNDQLADFSNVGSCVHIHAPGIDITSAWHTQRENTCNGTSTSAPHVTGILATLLSTKKYRNVKQGTDELFRLATRVSSDSRVKYIPYNGYSVDGDACQTRRFGLGDLFEYKKSQLKSMFSSHPITFMGSKRSRSN